MTTISELATRLRDGTDTCVSLVERAVSAIEVSNGTIHSALEILVDRSIEEARILDRELADGRDRGILHGIPFGVKDIFDVKGSVTTCQSAVSPRSPSVEDSVTIRRLKRAGAICVAKLATHEFALGGPDEQLPAAPARNPWNVEHIPGASSSGSGAAVSAGILPFALGSDTSGSVRGPAAACGVVGIKPTFGRVPRSGTFPLSHSMDHIGVIATSALDAWSVLKAIEGPDGVDLSCQPIPESALAHQPNELNTIRVGVATNLHELPATSEHVLQAIEWSANVLIKSNIEVSDTTLPARKYFDACGRVIMMAEALSIHRHNLSNSFESYGRFTRERIAPAAIVTSSDLVDAYRLRQQLANLVADGPLRDFDFLLTATALSPPPRFSDFPAHWPPPEHASASNTIAFNVTGHPAVAIPVGLDTNGLPISVQLIGRAWHDRQLLELASIIHAAWTPPPVPNNSGRAWDANFRPPALI